MKDDRFSAIRQMLYASGASSIQEIADAVGASPATIRRDLQVMEQEGAVTRTRGGARIADSVGIEVAFQHRERQNLPAKRAIAELAFQKVVPHSAIFLDAGTTVLQLARCIRLDPMPLSVFTNCIVVAQVLMDVAGIKLTLIGGALRAENASMVGALAEAMLERLWFDQLFLGAGALSDDCCIYSLDEAEARLNEKMLARASAKALLIDSSKFGKRLPYRVAPVTPDLQVLTDEDLAPDWRARLAEAGSAPVLAPVAGGQP
ncbi:DeoR/GlpR family DNA-binding transcription regulator [Consotaella salsifontis]|uniref:Transcriptional regulator, DeoR family n=1 Tax=Consotaella salsifontis TaxID=1365950 RepID=A0A1T4RNP0_9HYPH|nr:DeoR/GlpR family DNA-binding transcription regulator [Consotaella salsifontis]SKA17620.1 transcriptional regulator, DeoR family [Consotaella salsifontis]